MKVYKEATKQNRGGEDGKNERLSLAQPVEGKR